VRGADKSVSKRFFFVIPVLVFGGLAILFGTQLGHDPKIVPSALIDQPVPDFDLPPLKQDKGGLATADLNGQVALVNIFASWCLPCRAEHPLLMRLAEQNVVAVHGINYKDKPEAALAWLGELGDPYTRIGIDSTGRAAIDWGVYGVPETFIVDREGRIRHKVVGPLTPRSLEEEVLPVVRELGR